MTNYSLDKLNKMYESAKICDKSLVSEQKTNVLLRNGDHYNKKAGEFVEELRSRGVISKDKKIRITKNHIHRITNIYANQILSANPSATAVPYNEQELQDVKAAELSNSVMEWVKDSCNWKKKQERFVNDFVILGECIAKISFDYTKGNPVAIDADTGEQVMDGAFDIERVFGFDLKRDPNARDMDEAKWVIHESMVSRDDFNNIVKANRPDLVDKIAMNDKKTVRIFDHSSGGYRETKDEVFIREIFTRPSTSNGNKGGYTMWVDEGKIIESDLPLGLWPFIYEGFDEMTTSPRHTSIIKVCRPYQVEINRASSKMAEHQITLGDDRVYIQKGTKISNGGKIHGVRAIQVAGQQPVVQEGRSGAQYLDYQLAQVKEMYEACNLSFVMEEKAPKGDAYAMLFASMKDKVRFAKYVSKYQRFEIEIFKLILKMAKTYLTEQHVIKVAGRGEIMNVAEFKDISDIGYEIKVEPSNGDIDERFGKNLALSQVLQYAGTSLSPDQLGQLIKQLPFGSQGDVFSTLTNNDDNLKNTILAMDRGEQVPVAPFEDHDFMLRGLDHRMKKPDFKFMPPQIQQLYAMRIQEHTMYKQQAIDAEIARQNGLIPTGGALVTIQISMMQPDGQVQRIKLPHDSIMWLHKTLQEQGAIRQSVNSMPGQAAENIQIGTEQLPPDIQAAQPQIEQAIINEAASLGS